MSREKAALDSKIAQFTLLREMAALDDGDDGDDADMVNSREERRRLHHRQFFSNKESNEPPISETNTPTTTRESLIQGEGVATPVAANAVTAVIESTQPGSTKNIITLLPDAALADIDEVEFIKETPREVIRTKSLLDQQRTTSQTPLKSNKRGGHHHHQADAKPSVSSPSLNAAAAVMRKRKRDDSGIKPRPENEQIFKDMKFYFVPNNDIAPARRLRIAKAKEFGAEWTRDGAAATHVVVDKGIQYSDIALLINETSQSVTTIVTEEYPVDCIRFRAVLDPAQKKYMVPGQPITEKEPEKSKTPLNTEDRISSLKLKTSERDKRRADFVPEIVPTSPPNRSDQEPSKQMLPEVVPDSQLVIIDAVETTENLRGEPLPNESESVMEDDEEDVVTKPQTDLLGIGPDLAKTTRDELSSYISIMQEFKDLPLDADDEEDRRSVANPPTIENDSDEEEEEEEQLNPSPENQGRRIIATEKNKTTTFEDRFACNRAGAKIGHDDNPNARTIEVLQNMLNYYMRVNDTWRIMAYRKAIGTLKRQVEKINTEQEALQLPSIGRGLAQKIEEIATTDKLRRLEYAKEDAVDDIMQLFLGIYGVGSSLAQQWIAKGYRNFDDLRANVKLTPNQQIGIEHYDDLNTRIPRVEIEALAKVVRTASRAIDDQIQLIIGGSYRRGAPDSSDIDFIVTKKATTSVSELRPFLHALTRQLEADGFLVAKLASGRAFTGDGSLWHGCCVLPETTSTREKIWRRIDFLLVPETEMGGALIYFTGDDIFNRSMRLLAQKKGMRLNQRGLYRRPIPGQRPTGKGASAGSEDLIEGADEKRIFEILGVKWRRPEERWC